MRANQNVYPVVQLTPATMLLNTPMSAGEQALLSDGHQLGQFGTLIVTLIDGRLRFMVRMLELFDVSTWKVSTQTTEP